MSDEDFVKLRQKMLNDALRAGKNRRTSIVVPVGDQVALIEGYDRQLALARKEAHVQP
ncbi:MAG: hypothetical protein ACYCOU_00275 [Sulfobacillus sp.]